MTWIFQVGLAIESGLNILGAGSFILYPEWCLSFVVSTKSVPLSAAILWQIYGILVLALTVPLLLCIPDSSSVFEKRRIVFQTLVAGEVGLLTLLLWHARNPQNSGITWAGLVISAGFLLPALIWHSFATWVNPALMRRAVPDAKKVM